jgi:hypothetical protein
MVNAVVAPKISPYAVFNGSAVPLELLSIVLYFEVGVIQGQMAHGIFDGINRGRSGA